MRIETLAEEVIASTVRIEVAREGRGTGMATGFVLCDGNELFLVTARHVIEGVSSGRIWLHGSVNGAPTFGRPTSVALKDLQGRWVTHARLDVAMAHVNDVVETADVFIQCLGTTELPTDDDVNHLLDAIEEVILIGYPVGVFDTKSTLPIVRKGLTATPYSEDFEGEPMFLVDGPVYPGLSGAPVLIAEAGTHSSRGKGLALGNRIFLLGVLTHVFQMGATREVEAIHIPGDAIPRVEVEGLLHLGIAAKGTVLREMVHDWRSHADPSA